MKDLENVKDLNGNAAYGSFIIIMENCWMLRCRFSLKNYLKG